MAVLLSLMVFFKLRRPGFPLQRITDWDDGYVACLEWLKPGAQGPGKDMAKDPHVPVCKWETIHYESWETQNPLPRFTGLAKLPRISL